MCSFICIFIHLFFFLPSTYPIYPTHTKALLFSGTGLGTRAIIESTLNISRWLPIQVGDTGKSTDNYNTGFHRDSVQGGTLFLLHSHPGQFHSFHDFRIHLCMNESHTHVSNAIIFPECQVHIAKCLWDISTWVSLVGTSHLIGLKLKPSFLCCNLLLRWRQLKWMEPPFHHYLSCPSQKSEPSDLLSFESQLKYYHLREEFSNPV